MEPENTPGFVACIVEAEAEAVIKKIASLFGKAGYAVIAKANDMQFQSLAAVDLLTALTVWEEGRIFSSKAEVRWQRTAQKTFAVLMLSEDQKHIPADWQCLGTKWTVVTHNTDDKLRLWGERKAGWPHWIEVRIPRALVYPVAKTTGSVRVEWMEYRDQQGTPRFIRLKEVG